MHINRQGESLVMYYYAGADALVACLFCTALRCNCNAASEGKGLCASTFGAAVHWPGNEKRQRRGSAVDYFLVAGLRVMPGNARVCRRCWYVI